MTREEALGLYDLLLDAEASGEPLTPDLEAARRVLGEDPSAKSEVQQTRDFYRTTLQDLSRTKLRDLGRTELKDLGDLKA